MEELNNRIDLTYPFPIVEKEGRSTWVRLPYRNEEIKAGLKGFEHKAPGPIGLIKYNYLHLPNNVIKGIENLFNAI